MLTLLTLLACLPNPAKRPAGLEEAKRVSPATQVQTAQGPVVGISEDGATRWQGVPFAAAPVGELRWRPAQPPPAREGVFIADRPKAPCIQADDWSATRHPADSEDCLGVNIWRPEGAKGPLPVMLWIPGGGFVSGTGGSPLYDGARLAQAGGVIVATISYRLGALGFLAHPDFAAEDPAWPASGNYGLSDQVQALRWVQENIAAFGGDPSNVTIFGESAGAFSVCELMASPLTEGLFHKAIMQSGGCSSTQNIRGADRATPWAGSAYDQGRAFAERAGCAGADDLPACLRALSVDAVQATLPPALDLMGGADPYGPIVDGHLLPQGPLDAAAAGQTAAVPLLIGFTANEASIFVGRSDVADAGDLLDYTEWAYGGGQALILDHYAGAGEPLPATRAIIGDRLFVCPSLAFAEAHAAAGNAVFLYHLTYISSFGRLTGYGAHHASDLPLVFDSSFGGGGAARAPRPLVDGVQSWWTQFAARGAPGETQGIAWLPIDQGHMELDSAPIWREDGVKADTCAVQFEATDMGWAGWASPP